ncbi:MAG: acetylglutamate kinase [Kiritimatiellaeota bacterium]|nr:acetylglutamate kinase [Kiritimatiellota bacterium]
MEKLIEKAAVLVEALPYIQEFRDAVVVVKFGGSAMEDPNRVRGVLRDIVFMECAGMKPVVVHGGGKAISRRLEETGIETRFLHGLRYTDARIVQIVDEVLHHEINAALVRTVAEFDGRPVGISGKSVLRAEKLTSRDPATGEPVDFGFVGRVVGVDPGPVQAALDRRQVPIVTPLGKDGGGQVYNINADTAACELAAALKARKLVFLSDVPGILRRAGDEASLVSTVRRDEVDALIAQGVIAGGMVPKVRSAVAALDAGTQKVHMIDGRVRHALLLEIFTAEGIGTQIVG